MSTIDPFPEFGEPHPLWPAGSSWPDYFMLGDPHGNFYVGAVYYDDIRLQVPHSSR